MGNARKQLFFGPDRFPSITFPICPSLEPYTWKHILTCRHQHIHALRIKWHNKVVWVICQFLVSSSTSWSFILINAGTFQDILHDNIVPSWLLSCSCGPHCFSYHARLRPDILCVRDLPYNGAPPTHPHPNLVFQFIEFNFYNDRFSPNITALKYTKYQPFITILQSQGWNVAPLMVLTVGTRATTHIPSILQLHHTFKIPKLKIKHIFTNINIIAIHHAMSILLHKRRIENNQPIFHPFLS